MRQPRLFVTVLLAVAALSGCATQAQKAPAAVAAPSARKPPAATEAPLDLAVTALQRFCRPDLPKSQWIADLDPLLTLEAASAYATVDPARVQCSRVVLPARKEEGDGFTQVLVVRTDRSLYRVVLSRSSMSDPYLVFRIAPEAEK